MSEPIITECPSCHARFRVTDGQLKIARGQVRCGACLLVFDANTESQRLRLRQQHPQDADSQELEDTPLPPPALAVQPTQAIDTLRLSEYMAAASEQVPSAAPPAPPSARRVPSYQPPERSASAEQDNAPAPPTVDLATPAQAERRDQSAANAVLPHLYAEPILLEISEEREDPVTTAGWLLASLAALAVLAGQYLWFERATLAQNPSLRPFYTLACEHLSCALGRVDLQQLVNEQLVVRPHPQFNDALSVDLRLLNHAAFEQPFPALRLAFADVRGHLVAERVLEPNAYLRAGTQRDTLLPARMPPNVPIEIHLEITDPGTAAVSYELQLMTP